LKNRLQQLKGKKMKRLKTLLWILICSSSFLFAQKKDFTTQDIIYNSYTSLAPSYLKQLQWIPGSDAYSYIKNEGGNFILVKSYVKSEKTENILTLENLSAVFEKEGLKAPARFPRFTWLNPYEIQFMKDTLLLRYNFNTKQLKIVNKIPKGAENIQLAPDKKSLAFTIKNNLYFAANKGIITEITNDKNPGIVNGHTVHRVEFGINKGIFWSPKGNYIAFYRKDETMVTDYPVVDYSVRPAKCKPVKYPMAGMTSQQVTLGIYNIHTGKKIFLKTGTPKDHYLTCVTWEPTEKNIYVAILNRDQNHLWLIKYDVANGEPIDTLFEETDSKYVHPEHPLTFIPNHPDEFLWRSQRDGWDHLYLYNTNGKLLRQVTKGNWVVLNFLGFDQNAKNIFITSTKASPIERHLYKVNLQTGKIIKLTKGNGTHGILLSDNGKYFIDKFNSMNVPGITSIFDSEGNKIKTIHKSGNPIENYNLGRTKIFKIKAADNKTDLYCRMVYPVNFDSSKKYPVIVYVYGGPGVQLVTNSWPRGRYAFWFQKMAEKGFIVFTLDNRGSANRGMAFEQATFRHLGTVEIEDQLQGVKYLKSLPFVDSTRFGVFGWSFGGFMTTSLMTRTNAFKVGVGGGAVIDWRYYEVMYTERYMDTPQTNPEGYKEASLLSYVENLRGKKLLLVHGTSDVTVVWQHTLMFAKRAADMNIPLDYYPYVGHQHGVYGPDAVHLYNKITQYFLDNL